MNKIKFAVLFMIFILGLSAVNAQDESKVAITLERTACFGTCPIYTISILENGDVIYNGEKFVDVTGEQKSQIDPATVALMVKAFENAGYFDWKEAYDTMTVTDMPSAITSVTSNGKTHRINHYFGDSSAPVALSFLEQWVDEMIGSSGWTGSQASIANISNGSETPIITLQRTACFGTCPVYSLAIYSDGTLVHMGSAHVDDIGVTVSKLDASSLESVVQQANALGYFNWKDRYDTMVKTDQAYIITSILGENGLKQITRYDGDPNAPVGLTWIEESIDQLVTNAGK